MEHLKNWLGDLMDGIADSRDTEACLGLLKNCGANCARRNALPSLKDLKAELSGLSEISRIAEAISRHTGAECVPDDGGFLLTYNRGKGCDCTLVKDGYISSPVFCNCTLGFHQTVWGEIFERPVKVDLVETFLRGGNCCSQRITVL